MTIFEAAVQYDDFKGTVAADISDTVSMRDFLAAGGFVEPSEIVVGYRVCFGENHAREIETPGLVVYVARDCAGESIDQVRAIEVDMPIAKLFSFFKRFDCVMTHKSISLAGVEVHGPFFD